MSTRDENRRDENGAPSAAARRFHYGLKVGVIALAMTATAVFGVLLASRASVRLDVTATREHRLSPRTDALLKSLDRKYDIVIAAPRKAADPRAWQRLGDVLEVMTRSSEHVGMSVIDTGSAGGTQQFAALLEELAARAKPTTDAAVTQVSAAADRADAAGKATNAVAEAMIAAGQSAGASTYGEQFIRASGTYSKAGSELVKVAAQAKAALATPDAAFPVPATDAVAVGLRGKLEETAQALSDLIGDLRALSGEREVPQVLKDRFPGLVEQAGAARDAAARTAAALAAVKHPPVLAVARQIQRSAAALVIAEPRSTDPARPGADDGRFVAAVPIDRLLPARRTGDGAAAPAPDTRFLAEELLASGIDALQTRARPIVVFVHAAPMSLAPGFDQLRGLVERLALVGIDCADWSVVRSAEPPTLAALNPDGSRPVVYVTIAMRADTAEGATRMAKLADAISRLVDRGERVLVSVAPSPLRGMGAPDPMVSYLEPLGVVADSGRPLLREFSSPQRRVVTDEMIFTDPGSDHPVSQAIRGIATALIWPMPITLDPAKAEAAHATLAPIVLAPADPALWAESQWQDFRARPERAALPAKDSPADLVGGPWTVAAAIERPTPDGDKTTPKQRIVVVGSEGWFMDPIAMASTGMVDGRLALAVPGNMELFIASVLWLCHMDERIASGPVVGAVATIPPLEPGTLSLLRWVLIAGVPVGVLALGVAWRMVKG